MRTCEKFPPARSRLGRLRKKSIQIRCDSPWILTPRARRTNKHATKSFHKSPTTLFEQIAKGNSGFACCNDTDF
jgi:hypothetical protein